jgi:hypothetical protein
LQDAWQPAEQPFWQPGLQVATLQRPATVAPRSSADGVHARFDISRTNGSLTSFACAAPPATRAPTNAPMEPNAVTRKFLRLSLASDIAFPPLQPGPLEILLDRRPRMTRDG